MPHNFNPLSKCNPPLKFNIPNMHTLYSHPNANTLLLQHQPANSGTRNTNHTGYLPLNRTTYIPKFHQNLLHIFLSLDLLPLLAVTLTNQKEIGRAHV